MDWPPPRTRQEAAHQTNKMLRGMITGFRARMDEELKSRHVTLAQLRVLNEIKQNPGASGASLARACGITPQSAQAMLVRAVERGWARRSKNTENERLVTTTLTRAGEHLLTHAAEIKARIEAEVWAGVPLADLRQMNATLAHGLNNLEG